MIWPDLWCLLLGAEGVCASLRRLALCLSDQFGLQILDVFHDHKGAGLGDVGQG